EERDAEQAVSVGEEQRAEDDQPDRADEAPPGGPALPADPAPDAVDAGGEVAAVVSRREREQQAQERDRLAAPDEAAEEDLDERGHRATPSGIRRRRDGRERGGGGTEPHEQGTTGREHDPDGADRLHALARPHARDDEQSDADEAHRDEE